MQIDFNETDVLIRCGSQSIKNEIMAYINELDLDFIAECKRKGLKIRYFDVDFEASEIIID